MMVTWPYNELILRILIFLVHNLTFHILISKMNEGMYLYFYALTY